MDARHEIENLLYTYAERMDAGDLAGVARLFEHALYAAGDGPGLRDAGEVERVNRALIILYEDGTPRTQHVTTNVRIDLLEGGRSALCSSLFTVFQAPPGGAPIPIVLGRYRDRFECVNGAWRFSERRIHVDQVGDVSHHLRSSPTELE